MAKKKNPDGGLYFMHLRLLGTRNVQKQTWWGYFHVYSEAHTPKIIAAEAEKQELLIAPTPFS